MDFAHAEFERLLEELSHGNEQAEPELFSLIYEELRRLAAFYISRERPDHTLQATALVHEAYIRLCGAGAPNWRSRSHFFGFAAQSMRRILVDYARSYNAEKRGGRLQKVTLDEPLVVTEQQSVDLMALDEALTRLGGLDARQSQIVELKFFGGLTVDEIANVLDVSARTVEREWELARGWLYQEVSG